MSRLTIHLRGLTALVRVNECHWRVVLPNALYPRVSKLDPCCIIEEHYANIALPEDDIDRDADCRANFKGRIHIMDERHMDTAPMSERKPEMLFHCRPFYDVFLTPHHEIKLHGVSKSQRLDVDLYDIDTSRPPSEQEHPGSLRWTADICRISHPAPKIKCEVIRPDPPIDLVAAYLDIFHGEIRAAAIIPQDRYTFINSGRKQTPSQCLAFEVIITLNIEEKASIELRDRRCDCDHAPCHHDNLKIKLKKERDIMMVIDNAPLEDIIAIRRTVGTEPTFSGEPFYHFEIMYDLLQGEYGQKIFMPVAPEYLHAPHMCPPFTRCSPILGVTTNGTTDPSSTTTS